MADINIDTTDGALETVSVADVVSTAPAISTMSVNPSIYDAITVAENVSTPVFTLKLYRGAHSVTVTLVTEDWSLVDVFKQFANVGVPLKTIILIPGGTDTFSIKDGSDVGAYLYYQAISAADVIAYSGALVKPYIDFSECSLNAGHKITFLW